MTDTPSIEDEPGNPRIPTALRTLAPVLRTGADSTLIRVGIYLLILALLLLVGCARQTPRISYQTTPAAGAPMRVAVMPFAAADGVGRAASTVGEAFAAALRSAGHHEVVLVPPTLARSILGAAGLERSTIRVEDLLAIRDHLRADAVVVGRIEQAATFDPVALGLTAHLVSCTDGEVLWSATAHFDAARKDVQEDLEDWYADHGGEATSSVAGWRLALRSPLVFARYASDRLVDTIAIADPPNPRYTAEAPPTASATATATASVAAEPPLP